MKGYPNYRITAEIVIKKGDKILLAKRREDVQVMPGHWYVPAGKVRYDEIPKEGMYRECLEETGLKAEFIRELSVRTIQHETEDEICYRCVFTYLVKAQGDDYSGFSPNDEHTEFSWVTKEEIYDEKYSSLRSDLKEIITREAFK